ncbi:hypothetical protein BLD48_05890 [Exiguobacterium sp. KRL4]|uniref:hypothetical protein n=1 Tax=Exiguobacterium sp. KRL4 TaxID=1914536 RepID=UPI0008F80C40|nr:hypothetical protein [Exiguobacterium sp. KRL4]OIN67417.1 hypothetical protein BLD48_05890 [Exiguobacterium sp. KRL4]
MKLFIERLKICAATPLGSWLIVCGLLLVAFNLPESAALALLLFSVVVAAHLLIYLIAVIIFLFIIEPFFTKKGVDRK